MSIVFAIYNSEYGCLAGDQRETRKDTGEVVNEQSIKVFSFYDIKVGIAGDAKTARSICADVDFNVKQLRIRTALTIEQYAYMFQQATLQYTSTHPIENACILLLGKDYNDNVVVYSIDIPDQIEPERLNSRKDIRVIVAYPPGISGTQCRELFWSKANQIYPYTTQLNLQQIVDTIRLVIPEIANQCPSVNNKVRIETIPSLLQANEGEDIEPRTYLTTLE